VPARRHPHLYEINTRLFLRRLSAKYRRNLTVATVPDEEWADLSRLGFDLVWLMGVWQRSPASRRQALLDPALRREYGQALPGWTEQDIAGSPYAVYSYRIDPSLGGPGELARLREQLQRHGLGLVLDFVPNHLATDHPWVAAHPGWFVRGQDEAVRRHPDWFFTTGDGVYLAHGRDPYFPPWTDTAQLNFHSAEMRAALAGELRQIAALADGVRCDMAMLALNEVFGRVWGEVVNGGRRAEAEFWEEAIRPVKRMSPDFLFLAEVYWGLEGKLQELGFDFTYNKELYDRLRSSPAGAIRDYLLAAAPGLPRSAHFTENHDELRAVAAFGRERSQAAAVVTATLPGLRLFHDGQLTGRRARLPVQMVRELEEPADADLLAFYRRLLAIVNSPAYHDGHWQPLAVNRAWEGNESRQDLLAWAWHGAAGRKIVVVNYSPRPAQGRLAIPLPPAGAGRLLFLDELTGTAYDRDPDEVSRRGLYIALDPYHAHLFELTAP